MMKLAKRMNGLAVMGAIMFMVIQVISDLYLPNLTADIIDNGIATGDVSYIISVGVKMLGFSLLSVAAATGNVFLASQQSQLLGKNIRSSVFKKVSYFSISFQRRYILL